MHLINETIKILEHMVYKECTENSLEDISTFEMGRVADIIKDFSEAMYYYAMAMEKMHDEEA